jgi:hypothetical protein
MTDLDKAVATQLANVEKRTGKTIAELSAIVRGSGLAKHGEIVAMREAMRGFGTFEEAPGKAYVGYRRKQQFTMLGPGDQRPASASSSSASARLAASSAVRCVRVGGRRLACRTPLPV